MNGHGPLRPDDILFSFDVERLYPSFELDDVQSTIHEFMKMKIAARHPLHCRHDAAEEEELMNELR
eukprot:SAG11_NODE_27461_length_332_cov_1.077253_1_plen_65_part_10